MGAMRVDGGAIVAAERGSVLAILGRAAGPRAVDAIGHDAQSHADWLVDGAKQAIPPGPIACREGCDPCCHLRVTTTIPEVLRIADHLRATRDDDGLAALRGRIGAHRDAMAVPPGEVRLVRAACPLLERGLCTVYPIRPMSCRGWNSLDEPGCRADKADPSRGVRVPVYGPQLEINARVQDGLVAGLDAAGLESHRVELVAALRVAIDLPDAAGRWRAGERLFGGVDA